MARTKRTVLEGGSQDADAAGAARGAKAAAADTAAAAGGFARGAVLRVTVYNFMTFSGPVDLNPGPRLNLILGPNGTGKSSFVCAICLGLGGGAKLLGRSDSVGEYVARGHDEGWVEVALKGDNPTRPVLIKRILRTDNSSRWFVDGKEVNLKQVKERMADLNVQLDNLCQFLPQDRVVKFSELSPKELLLETERALESSELFDLHQGLIKKKEDLAGLEQRLQTNITTLQRKKDQNAHLEKDLQRHGEREELLKDVEKHKLKVPHLRLQRAQAVFADAAKALADTTKAKQDLDKEVSHIRKPLAQVKDRYETARGAHKQLRKELSRLDEKRVELDKELLMKQNDIETEEANIDDVRRKSEQRKERVARARQAVADLERELEELASQKGPIVDVARINELKNKQIELRTRVRELQNELQNAQHAMRLPNARLQHAQDKLRELDDARGQRLNALAQHASTVDIRRAVQWVEANRNRFQEEVFGPIALELEFPNPAHARYVEQACSLMNLTKFVTTNQHDRDLLNRELQPFGASCINMGGAVQSFAPPTDKRQLEQFGITHTLDETFDAPSAVRSVLCATHGLHSMYVGTESTDKHMQKVLEIVGTVWTPTAMNRLQRSRYNRNASSTIVQPLRAAKVLTGTAMAAERDEMQVQISEAKQEIQQGEGRIQELEQGAKATERELAKANREREELVKERDSQHLKKGKIEGQLQTKKRLLQSEEKGVEDPEVAVARHKKRIAALVAQVQTCMNQLADTVTNLMRRTRDTTEASLAVAELETQVRHYEGRMKQHEAALAEAARQLQRTKQEHDEAKQRVATCKQSAPTMTAELESLFAKIPDDIVELEELIKDMQSRADSIVLSNPNALQEYQQRKAEIASLEQKVAEDEEKRVEGQGSIDADKDLWLPKLKDLVQKVHVEFKRNFATVGCVGEVALEEAGEAYVDYAISIKVKFREKEPLQQLDSHRQSGGERSVSTMLYLISLQDLTKAPFRVVDEINQGMDAINERKVFQAMVKAATQPGTPQCFLLTPKLLPQLDYSPDVTVLLIFNGPYLSGVGGQKWNNKLCFGAAPVAQQASA